MKHFIKIHLIAFLLSNFSSSELRDIVSEVNLRQANVYEKDGIQFSKSGRFKDKISIVFGTFTFNFKEGDFLELISEIEKEEETANHIPAK